GGQMAPPFRANPHLRRFRLVSDRPWLVAAGVGARNVKDQAHAQSKNRPERPPPAKRVTDADRARRPVTGIVYVDRAVAFARAMPPPPWDRYAAIDARRSQCSRCAGARPRWPRPTERPIRDTRRRVN